IGWIVTLRVNLVAAQLVFCSNTETPPSVHKPKGLTAFAEAGTPLTPSVPAKTVPEEKFWKVPLNVSTVQKIPAPEVWSVITQGKRLVAQLGVVWLPCASKPAAPASRKETMYSIASSAR